MIFIVVLSLLLIPLPLLGNFLVFTQNYIEERSLEDDWISGKGDDLCEHLSKMALIDKQLRLLNAECPAALKVPALLIPLQGQTAKILSDYTFESGEITLLLSTLLTKGSVTSFIPFPNPPDPCLTPQGIFIPQHILGYRSKHSGFDVQMKWAKPRWFYSHSDVRAL